MPLSVVLRRAAVVGAGLLSIAGIAAWSPLRISSVNAADLPGVYQVMPVSRGNPTSTLVYMRFTADGMVRSETVRLHDTGASLAPTVTVDSAHSSRWTLDGSRICTGEGRRGCSPIFRDDATGDLTIGDQQLVRLREQGLVIE